MIRMTTIALAFAGGCLVPGSATVLADDVTPAEARAIAKEAYIYGFPVVDDYRIQYAYFVEGRHGRAMGEARGPERFV